MGDGTVQVMVAHTAEGCPECGWRDLDRRVKIAEWT
jgi:hypothetical protein